MENRDRDKMNQGSDFGQKTGQSEKLNDPSSRQSGSVGSSGIKGSSGLGGSKDKSDVSSSDIGSSGIKSDIKDKDLGSKDESWSDKGSRQ